MRPPLFNMVLTARGIYTDLNYSTYFVKVGENKFYFSSKIYRDKFALRIREHRDFIENMVKDKFKIENDIHTLSDIMLYGKIEKRGFRIVMKGVECQCIGNLILSGEVKIQKL